MVCSSREKKRYHHESSTFFEFISSLVLEMKEDPPSDITRAIVETVQSLIVEFRFYKGYRDFICIAISRAYVVFERENFNHFSFSRFYYVTQITRISLPKSNAQIQTNTNEKLNSRFALEHRYASLVDKSGSAMTLLDQTVDTLVVQ